jgi:hypothetical protein
VVDVYVTYLSSVVVQFWAYLGIALIVVDLMVLTGVLFFLGVGALITVLAVSLGLAPSPYIQIAWCFASGGLIGIVFRKGFVALFQSRKG